MVFNLFGKRTPTPDDGLVPEEYYEEGELPPWLQEDADADEVDEDASSEKVVDAGQHASDGVSVAVQQKGDEPEIPEHLLEDNSNSKQISAGRYSETPEQWANRVFKDDDMAEEVETAKELKPYQEMSSWRYWLPSFLGGASDEEKKAYELKMARTYTGEAMRQLTWWDRLPRFLGGKGYVQTAIYHGRKEMGHLPEDVKEGETVHNPLSEIVKGVTIEDLEKSGFSRERALQIKENVDKALDKKAQEAGVEKAGLAAHLAQHGQKYVLNQKDLGVTRAEMRTIVKLSQREK